MSATLAIKAGDHFGPLTALRAAPPDIHKHRRWLFRCTCGAETVRVVSSLYRSINQGRGIAGCMRCQRAEHSKRLRENYHGARTLARRYGSVSIAAELLHPVDIDSELPETFG